MSIENIQTQRDREQDLRALASQAMELDEGVAIKQQGEYEYSGLKVAMAVYARLAQDTPHMFAKEFRGSVREDDIIAPHIFWRDDGTACRGIAAWRKYRQDTSDSDKID